MEAVAVLKRPVAPSPATGAAVLPELIGLVYEGLNEARPWGGLAERLRQVLAAINVTVTLLHAEDRPTDIQVMAVEEDDDTDWLLAERLYRERFAHIELVDPKALMPGDLIVFGPEDVEAECAAHMVSLNLASCLRTCFAEPGGMRCWVDVIRGRTLPARPFSTAERELVAALLPHLTRALGLYARLKRQEAEKAIYEGCLDHLLLGCLLLDGDGRLLCANRAARGIVDKHRGIELSHGRVQLQDRAAQQALERAIAHAVAAGAREGGHCRGELVRLQARDGVLLGMLATPAPLLDYYYQGRHVPSAIIYLSELTESLAMQPLAGGSAAEPIAQLLDLTRQEARLAALLAGGQTISEAAGQMGIAVTAARNYSKNIYAKLGIKGQTDLVRILFKSFALLR